MVGASEMATGVVVGSAMILAPASPPPLGPKTAPRCWPPAVPLGVEFPLSTDACAMQQAREARVATTIQSPQQQFIPEGMPVKGAQT